MSKIICDVCGTSYPESVTQCPICGCVRAVEAKTVPDSPEQDTGTPVAGGYTHVKGGRFSKSNVKKRNNGKKNVPQSQDADEVEEEEGKKPADKGLLIAFLVLLLSIAAVVCYILVRFFGGGDSNSDPIKKPDPGPLNTEPVVTTTPVVDDIACEDISLSVETIEFNEIGSIFQLDATVSPVDTTDVLQFTSSDDSVATVSADGTVVAVSAGEAVITVSCGDVQVQCSVSCTIQTVEPTVPVVPPAATLELNRSEFTLFKKGESWTLYRGDIPADEIKWSSNDEKVATVENGKVVAVSSGRAIITAEYQGNEVQCIVYCSSSVGAYVEPDDTDEDQTDTDQKQYKLNTADRQNDITIYVDDSYTLKLLDSEGKTVDAEFSSSDPSICTVSGGKVTGVSAGRVKVTATYNGESHTCIVRVRQR